MAGIALLFATIGGAAPHRGGLGVRVGPASQTALLERGTATLRIRFHGSGQATFSVGLRPSEGPEKRITSTGAREVSGAGTFKVALPLTAAGRRAVTRCQSAKLEGIATPEGSHHHVARELRIDRPGCTKGTGGGNSGGGNSGGGTGTGGGGGTGTGGGSGGVDNSPPPARPYQGSSFDTSNGCDWIDPSVCLYPFPNDFFTAADSSAVTGRRVNFNPLAMPRSRQNVPVSTLELNRNDGFSPGSSIITRIPGLDNPQAFQNTGAVPQVDMARYADPNQPVVVIDTTTNERWPIWSELDSNPASDSNRVLYIRPAKNFLEGHRYVVALRNLKDATDETIQAGDGFKVYRDNLTTQQAAVEARRPHMEQVFSELGAAGIPRSNLYLAWDFTVASRPNISDRMLEIRDDAFAQLGDTNLADMQIQGSSPPFTVTQVTNNPAGTDSNIAREVKGTFNVPCYMDTVGCSPEGSTFNYNPAESADPDRLPMQIPGNTAIVNYTCEIPRAAIDEPGASPARPSLYGHGLLGSQSEVTAGNVKAMAQEHDFMFCATDWYGFATTNAANILAILQDVSLFPLLADESQQGMLNFLYLGRAMVHPNGFTTNAAFHVDPANAGSAPVIDTTRLFYDGNSQGGILGGSLTAVAPDFNRAVLGVPAMNYSTLLQRSVDFTQYAEGTFQGAPDTNAGLYDNYPNELERPLIFALMQMLWDRAEPDGYAQHMTSDPLPDTPQHSVLLHPAFGDHQVANVAAEVEARTIGAGIYQPALKPGRANGDEFFGIPSITFPREQPYTGSAMVIWDGGPLGFPGGTATPPAANVPPEPPAYGSDPHSYPRSDVKARQQKSTFLQVNGFLYNPCTDGLGQPIPCFSHGYTGTP